MYINPFFIYFLLLLSPFITEGVTQVSLLIKKVPSIPDGYPRQVIAVLEEGNEVNNAPFPGPLIRATIGDTVHVKVKNELDSLTSVHFHGVEMLNNPWSDGVVGITECGIAPNSEATYTFNVTQTGTFWYHSHSGTQYGDGFYGPIIFDYKEFMDPVKKEYPYAQEHIIMLSDWFHETGDELKSFYSDSRGAFPGFEPHYPWPPVSILLNGKGTFNCIWDDCSEWNNTNFDECEDKPQCIPIRPPFFGTCIPNAHQPQEFTCPSGEMIRLRLINSASNLPLRFWIEKHPMIVVARDGVEIVPLERDSVTLPVAQRLDVIIKCNQDDSFRYNMYTSIPPVFIPKGAYIPPLYSRAFLTYPGSTKEFETGDNPINSTHAQDDDLLMEYKYRPSLSKVSEPADERITIMYKVVYNSSNGAPLEEWTVNGKSFLFPKKPLLSAIQDGSSFQELIQSAIGSAGNTKETNILHLELGKVYEFVIIGNDLQQHPWHIHGYTVDFIDAQKINTSIISANMTDSCNNTITDINRFKPEDHLLPFNKPATVLSRGDSFTVPGFGYVVFRFKADNPGPWFFHCHVEWHSAMGMAMVLSVEDKDGRYTGIYPEPDDLRNRCPTTIPLLDNPYFWITIAFITSLVMIAIQVLIIKCVRKLFNRKDETQYQALV